jgi:RHS repeat-associated protein
VNTTPESRLDATRSWVPHARAAKRARVCRGPAGAERSEHPRPYTNETRGGHQSTYDAMGSLIAVQLPDGRLIEYVTDGRNRRIGKMVNGTLVKQWLYRDEFKPTAELDGSGNIVAQFVYGTKPNVPDYIIRGGATYRVISDQLGSPVLAVNVANSSDVPLQATYAAFGERTLIAGTDDWMPFGFAGGLYDPDTKLTRFGVRDYDAKIGRWVSKDPIRFYGADANIYVYVGNDPQNWLDSSGLDPSFLSVLGLGVATAGGAVLAVGSAPLVGRGSPACRGHYDYLRYDIRRKKRKRYSR